MDSSFAQEEVFFKQEGKEAHRESFPPPIRSHTPPLARYRLIRIGGAAFQPATSAVEPTCLSLARRQARTTPRVRTIEPNPAAIRESIADDALPRVFSRAAHPTLTGAPVGSCRNHARGAARGSQSDHGAPVLAEG